MMTEPDRCATCGNTLPERSVNLPVEQPQYCETDWWAEQYRRQAAGEEVHPLAKPLVSR